VRAADDFRLLVVLPAKPAGTRSDSSRPPCAVSDLASTCARSSSLRSHRRTRRTRPIWNGPTQLLESSGQWTTAEAFATFPALWLSEVFANLALHAFIAAVRPSELANLTSFAEAQQRMTVFNVMIRLAATEASTTSSATTPSEPRNR
jgi:hypothetical protein